MSVDFNTLLQFIQEAIVRNHKWACENELTTVYLVFDTSSLKDFLSIKKDYSFYSRQIWALTDQVKSAHPHLIMEFDQLGPYMIVSIINKVGIKSHVSSDIFLAHIFDEFMIYKSWYQTHGIDKIRFWIYEPHNLLNYVPKEVDQRWNCAFSSNLAERFHVDDKQTYVEHCTDYIVITHKIIACT